MYVSDIPLYFDHNPAQAKHASLFILNRLSGCSFQRFAWTLFLADREHLFKYLRPITRTQYRMLPNATPSPTKVTNILPSLIEGDSLKSPLVPTEEHDPFYLSESDIEVLDLTLRLFQHIPLKLLARNIRAVRALPSTVLPYEAFFLDYSGDPTSLFDIMYEESEARISLLPESTRNELLAQHNSSTRLRSHTPGSTAC